eukprot:CAMPEP_0171911606 /NCGR_PEP_ID=MMETSP0993-20121228/10410_1 /TAXON_ID=483369 /ORGANISM="non described non described, Strain CCMP2098" /LENGTH=297 /DNA_ID=CAMNT_0012545155 /DNA_START=23 /DNA_END=913 /DNA_ORIENTATION=+
MGKERKKRNRKGKAPGGVSPASVSRLEDNDENIGAAAADKSGSITDMMASASPADRLAACSTYIMLFEGMSDRSQEIGASSAAKKARKGDKAALKRLLDVGAPGLLAGLLGSDPEPRVRGAAASALRGLLAVMGGLNATATADEVARAGLTATLLAAVRLNAEGVANAQLHQQAAATAQHLSILEPSLTALTELVQISPSALSSFGAERCDVILVGLLERASSASCSSSSGGGGGGVGGSATASTTEAGMPALGGVPAAVLRRAAHVLHVALERNPSLAAVCAAATAPAAAAAAAAA